MRGVYKDAYWFSFPNSCPLQPWTAKTHACRAQTARGLCPPGKRPDGVACTYTHSILGFLPLDDLVGITSMVNEATGVRQLQRVLWCREVEFAAYDRFGYVFKAIPFWQFPLDPQANHRRVQQMIDSYQKLASPEGSSSQIYFRLREKMQRLPTVDELTDQNPPCYETVRACGQAAEFGCKRETYAQICRLCVAEEKGCVKALATFAFPSLTRPETAPLPDRSEDDDDSSTTPRPSAASATAALLNTITVALSWLAFYWK